MKRFEKAMANRFLGGTKLGRSKILKRFGDTASNLVDGLKDAASKCEETLVPLHSLVPCHDVHA